MLTALIFAFTAGAAGAQPKPALVQDRDEPGRNPYQQVAVDANAMASPSALWTSPSSPPGCASS